MSGGFEQNSLAKLQKFFIFSHLDEPLLINAAFFIIFQKTSMELSDEKLRQIVRETLRELGPDADPDLIRKVVREVVRHLQRKGAPISQLAVVASKALATPPVEEKPRRSSESSY
jgi:RNase P protein component